MKSGGERLILFAQLLLDGEKKEIDYETILDTEKRRKNCQNEKIKNETTIE
jgi:hypothetical protein